MIKSTLKWETSKNGIYVIVCKWIIVNHNKGDAFKIATGLNDKMRYQWYEVIIMRLTDKEKINWETFGIKQKETRSKLHLDYCCCKKKVAKMMNDLVKYFYLSFVTFNLPWTSVTITTARNPQQMFAFKFYESKFVCVCARVGVGGR